MVDALPGTHKKRGPEHQGKQPTYPLFPPQVYSQHRKNFNSGPWPGFAVHPSVPTISSSSVLRHAHVAYHVAPVIHQLIDPDWAPRTNSIIPANKWFAMFHDGSEAS